MPKTLTDLIGPIGKQDRFQSFHTLLYSIGGKKKTLNVLIFIGHLLFGLQLNFMYLYNSSKLSWKSNKVHDTVLYIVNCVFSFTPGITTTTHLDYLVISLLVFVVTYLIIILTLFLFLKYSTDYQLDNVYPLGICVVGLHICLVPSCYSVVTYAFSKDFTSHYGMFILSIFVVLCSFVSTYIEYFVQYGIPKKDSIYNSKTIIFRFTYSIVLLTVPIFNFYTRSIAAIFIINCSMLILSIVYITQQFRLSSPRMLMSYTLSGIVFSLLNLIILIFNLDGETYVSIYIIAFNIGFLLILLISYFTKEYNLLPFREVIQTHDFSKFDKHSMFTLENIMTAASSQIDIPNEILDYLALRNPSSFVFNEIIFLQSKEYGNEERMKVALNTMLEQKTVDWIRETRICAFENCVRPTFLTIRANKALSDYSNTLGMFWNEIINDNTDHLISLTNQVASSYTTLTGLFKEYGTAGQLSSPYNKFCHITNYNAESPTTNLAYALVSRTGNKGESSFTCAHLTQNLFIYLAFFLLIVNLSINLLMDTKVNQMWNASIDAFKIIQSVTAGSFVSTIIQLNPSINFTKYVYSNKTFDSKLQNLTGDLQMFVNEITKHLNQLKAFKTEDFSQIINNWLVKQFNVTRFPSTVETAFGILASSYQSVVSGNIPRYDGLYVKGSTDLIIYSQNLFNTTSELSNYAIKMVVDYSRVLRIINTSFIFIGLILMILFAFIMLKSILSFFQPLFKLSKTDLITISKELISWVKDNHQQQEDNNIKYNRELIISKTHTNTYTNSIFRNNLIFKRFIMYLLFVIILHVYSESISSMLKGDATDIGSALYAYLMPHQLLKIGQLFLLARKDIVYNSNTSNTRRLLEESTLEMNNNMRYQCTTNSEESEMEKINRIVSEYNIYGQRNVLADDSNENETATKEMRKAHVKNLYTMIEFARKMVTTAVAKFAASNPRVLDIALYISVDISAPREQRSLFSAVDNAALNIYDSLNKNYKNEDFRSLAEEIIKIATTYSDLCEVSIQRLLELQRDNIIFSITMQAILSFSLIMFVLAIYTTNGTFWLNYEILTKCIISSLPKFNNSTGSLTDSISLSTREEEMKKSSAVVVDIMNSYELREDLLEHHVLLNSNEVVVSCSSLIEDFLSSPPMLGRKFDDCINAIGTKIPSELTNDDSNGKAQRTLFRPKDEKKRDIVMEVLKYKFDNLEMKEGNVSYVCVITDKSKEFEATVTWRNELNQLKLIGLQFMPSEVYESLTGDESVTTLQINNAYVSTFYIRGIKTIEHIAAVKQIVVLGCKVYSHIWPVARSTLAIKLYSGLLDQNISHFRALITLLDVSLRISKNLTDLSVEPHCVISKVKATHAKFGIDTPPIFEMRDDNPYDLILAMGSPAHKISISREPYEILYNTGIPTEFAFYFRSEGFHKVSYDTINEVESIIEREQMQLAIV